MMWAKEEEVEEGTDTKWVDLALKQVALTSTESVKIS